MNKQSPPIDTQDIEGFDSLQKEYQALSSELPDAELDKQIIAAAHRELANPNPRRTIQISWWRRLMLPVYVAATFTFTAIAAHWFWPQEGNPAKTLPGTAPATVSFEVAPPKQMAVERKQKRQKRELPEPDMLMAPPESRPSEMVAKQAQSEQIASSLDEVSDLVVDSESQGSGGKKVTVTGSRVQGNDGHAGQLTYPEKEQWARDIIGMFRDGKLEKARKELVRFKQVYPDYPIDQQLEPFRG